MRLVVVFNTKSLPGKLTKLFTGCYAYHVGWADDAYFYDMYLIRQRRLWPCYAADQILEFDFPDVTREYLEQKLSTDENTYGFKDYLLFLLRPLFHLFGASTPNAGGVICSEMANIDLRACGVKTPWSLWDGPPSPCDLYTWASRPPVPRD